MKSVCIASDNMITSLGFTTEENMMALLQNRIGFKKVDNPALSPTPLPLSSVDDQQLEEKFRKVQDQRQNKGVTTPYTRMEKMFIVSIADALGRVSRSMTGDRTLLILSTTKGNIDLLEASKKETFDADRIYLWRMGQVIQTFFGFAHPPEILSNACISGALAIGLAFRYLRKGYYDHIIVSGGDMLSQFVISGFQSFQALSSEACKPFDANRSGLSLGEGCGTMILTTQAEITTHPARYMKGFATTNDANHISGPSRTGEELALAIQTALQESDLKQDQVGYISAHGTATPFNDEMESKAIALSGLGQVPTNSFKGYWGHTLGAAGVLESIAAIHSMEQGVVIKSAGFEELGVPEQVAVVNQNLVKPYQNVLKTASGFGGCNVAVVFGLGESDPTTQSN